MNTVRFTVISIVLAGALLPSVARADYMAVFGASKDNTIFQNQPNNSGGGAAGIFSGTSSASAPRRGLIAFDITSQVPAGSTITSASLSMYLANQPPGNTTQTIGLRKMSLNWGENPSDTSSPAVAGTGNGVAAVAGDATWNANFFGTSTWPTAGATGSFSNTASASATVSSATIDTKVQWLSTSGLIADVQDWLDNPSTNFGWALVNADETTAQTTKAFYSHEATQNSSNVPNSLDPTWRPSLEITYTTSAPPSGDYNHNGVVDAADYVVWRKNFGLSSSPAGSGADGNQSSMIDDGDFLYWRAHFGNSVGGLGSDAAVPEPATALFLLVAGPLVFFRKWR